MQWCPMELRGAHAAHQLSEIRAHLLQLRERHHIYNRPTMFRFRVRTAHLVFGTGPLLSHARAAEPSRLGACCILGCMAGRSISLARIIEEIGSERSSVEPLDPHEALSLLGRAIHDRVVRALSSFGGTNEDRLAAQLGLSNEVLRPLREEAKKSVVLA
jgi:hypothetical protein